MDEINRLYPLEWVLVKATKTVAGDITEGEVLVHSRRRDNLNPIAARAWQVDPQALLLFHFGGIRQVSGDEFRRLLAEAIER